MVIKVSNIRNSNADIILRETARYFSLHQSDLINNDRHAELVRARQVAMYIVWKNTGLTLKEIGCISKRSEGNVHYACMKIVNSLGRDEDLCRDVDCINVRLLQ